MKVERLHCVADLRAAARRRVPRFAFDYLEGGAGDEAAVERNVAAFDRVLLRQFVLRDVRTRTVGVDVFGRRYDRPIGIAPVGLSNLIWPAADEALARAARAGTFPFVMSAAATTDIETIAAIGTDHLWFQLYVSADEEVTFDLIERAAAVGVDCMVVTVDLPVPAKRLRDLRNGFSLPFRLTPKMIADMIRHPAWCLATARAGTPRFRNMEKYLPAGTGNQPLAAFMARQITAGLDDALMSRIRDAWPGKLVVKGVMSTRTALSAIALGADGIIVSNHGGRQLQASPATIEVLPEIAAAVAGKVPVMLDSGIRCGADIVRAYALGADFVFSGRSFLYGYAAAGAAGLDRAVEILSDETDRTLGQIGAVSVADLDAAYIWAPPPVSDKDTVP